MAVLASSADSRPPDLGSSRGATVPSLANALRSGTFLIDSESRMKAAAAAIYGEPSADPVCGMKVDENKARAAGKTSEYSGRNYYFCSDECKTKFDKDPEKFAGKLPAEK